MCTSQTIFLPRTYENTKSGDLATAEVGGRGGASSQSETPNFLTQSGRTFWVRRFLGNPRDESLAIFSGQLELIFPYFLNHSPLSLPGLAVIHNDAFKTLKKRSARIPPPETAYWTSTFFDLVCGFGGFAPPLLCPEAYPEHSYGLKSVSFISAYDCNAIEALF